MSKVDKSQEAAWREKQLLNRKDREAGEEEFALKGGGGGGTSDGMDGRVSRLEALVDVTRDDLREIKGALSAIKDNMATKADIVTFKWQWVAVSIGILTLAITGMAGGLALVAYVLSPH